MFTPFEILIDMYNWHLRCRSIQQDFLNFIVQLLHKKASNIEKVLLEGTVRRSVCPIVWTFFKIFKNRYPRSKTARDILDLEETNKNFVSKVYFTSEIVSFIGKIAENLKLI